VRNQRLVEQLIGEIDATVAQRDAPDDETRQARVFRSGLAFRQAFDQRGEVVPAVPVESQVHHRRLEASFGKGPGAIDDAAQLEIDQQVFEAKQRLAVGVGKSEIVDLESEEQRIEAHVTDADRVAELRRDLFFDLPLDDCRQGEKTAEHIKGEQKHGDNHRFSGKEDSQAVEHGWALPPPRRRLDLRSGCQRHGLGTAALWRRLSISKPARNSLASDGTAGSDSASAMLVPDAWPRTSTTRTRRANRDS
jgi:hypothetical protein